MKTRPLTTAPSMHPGVTHPGVTHPGVTHPGVMHPGVMHPGVTTPNVTPPLSFSRAGALLGVLLLGTAAGSGHLVWAEARSQSGSEGPPEASTVPAEAATAPARTAPDNGISSLTLARALELALSLQPSLRGAEAQARASAARADQAAAVLRPQLGYAGTFAVKASDGSQTSPGTTATESSTGLTTGTAHTLSLSASQFLLDFGKTRRSVMASAASARASQATVLATRQEVVLSVTTAFHALQARQALLEVAREALANEDKHLAQVTALVEVGVRPEIDLAQSRLTRSNAELDLIQAQNALLLQRAELSAAMGLELGAQYLASGAGLEEWTRPRSEETRALDTLLLETLSRRPDYVAQELSLRSADLSLKSLRADGRPTLSLTGSLAEVGTDLNAPSPSAQVGLSLSGSIVTGGRLPARVREAEALVDAQRAALDGLKLQVGLGLEQARLSVRAARAALRTSEASLQNAVQRLALAEARYETGVGNILELGDAQLARTQAATQKVQAEFDLAVALARLRNALGEDGERPTSQRD